MAEAKKTLILTGARIYTANEQQPWAQVIAVKSGRFIYVGESESVSGYVSDETRVIDLDGRLVIPGLIDAHAHPGYIDVELYGGIPESDDDNAFFDKEAGLNLVYTWDKNGNGA